MSSSSWNCLEWLTTHYHLNNVGVNFFRTGKYLISQKEQAENDFKDTVFLLCNSKRNDIKKWARAEVETGYRSIINTETQAFWTSSAITSSIRNDIQQTESIQFTNVNKSSFEKRSNDESATSSPKRRDIEIIENDDVILNGLDGSLFSHLKTYAINRMHSFDSFSDKQKYYITMSMNNVIDLTDDTEFSQLHLLNPEQKEGLRTILKINKLSTDQPVVDKIKEKFAKYECNLDHCLSKVSKLFRHSNDDVSICGIYRYILETHLYFPNLFNESMESEMSEMDYILYFWGPIVKSLFINTDIWSHWGDTESRGCMYKFRLDLRLLSSKLKKSYDLSSGEFSRALTESKYYSDKQKLILNGIIQIDNILHTYKGNESDVKLPLFLALGFHADICFLYRKSPNVYVVDRIATVDFPTVKKDLVQKSIVLVDEFLKFKDMAVKLQDIVLESNSNTKKTVTNITSAESSSASKLPKRFVWQNPT